MAKVANPCTGICKFNDGLCLSCGRLRSEKKGWKRMSAAEREAVNARSAERVAALGDRAILSKKDKKKGKRKKKQRATTTRSAPVRLRPAEVRAVAAGAGPGEPPVVDPKAAKAARKAWKKAHRHARKAKKAARKAREADAKARGLSTARQLPGSKRAAPHPPSAANAEHAMERHDSASADTVPREGHTRE